MNKSQRSSKSPKKFRSNSLFPVMSTIPEGSSPTSKISNFFRRHRKSTNFSTEDENEVMSSSEMGGDVGGSNENLEKVNKKKEEFGNYNTVSGTGANLLRDVFNKKYRSSMKPSKSKLKKESIKEEESSEASNTLTASVGKKLHHDMHRSRHTSISYDSKRSFMPSIRGIFESFRSRSNRDSFSDVNQSANNSSTSPTSNPIPHTIVYAPGKKKKKFKVTRALEDEPNKFGFNSYLELYRKNQLDARPHHEQRPHHFSKASTIHAFEPMQIIIWKDKKRGTRVFKLPKSYTDSLEFEKSHGETIDSEELAMTRFSNSQSCYDLMPPSAKLIIFDIDLNVKKAFFALLQNGIKSAPIWSNQKHDYVGLLTVTDFLKIIKEYYHCSELDMKELEDQKISLWKTRLQDTEKPLRWVAPDTSLLAAISLMSRHHISHLPVVQYGNGNILYVLTAKRVLKYLASFMKTMIKDPNKEDNGNNYLQQSILHSEICSQQELYYATLKTPLIKVIDLFLEKGVSSLPVVVDDVSKKVVDVYTKADVLSIANDQMIDSLSTPIGEVLQKRQSSNQLQTCSINERLCDVINRIVQAAVHVIVVVSDRKELKRVISVSDLLSFIVLKPFYKYKDIMEKKRLKVQLLTESLHTQQQQRNLAPLPTLQENSTVEGSSFQQNIALQHQDPKPSTLEALFKAESTYVEKQLTEQPTATTTTTLLSTTTQLTTTTIQPTTKNTLLPNTTTATHSSSTIVATQQQPPTSTTQTTSSPQQPPSSSAPQEVKKMKFKKAETSINNNKKNKIGNKKKNNKNKDVNTNNNNNNTAAVNNNNNNSTTTTTTTATTTTATDNNGAKARATTAGKSGDVTNRANNFTNQCNNNNEPVGEIEKSINEGTSGFDQITNNNNKNNSNKNNGNNNNNNESSTLSKNPADKTSVETNNNNSIGTTAITTETNTLAMDNNNNNNDNNNNNINAATVATTSTTNDDKNDLTQVTTGTADDNDTDNNNNNIDNNNNNNADVVKDNRDTDVFNDKVGVGDAVDKKSGNNNSNNKNNSENNKNESQSNSSSVNNNNNSKTNKTKKVKKVVKKSTSSNKPS